MTTFIARAAVLFGGLTGCDLVVVPETSEYVGQPAARASLDVRADSMPSASDVRGVELTLDTVALHRPNDDRWVLLAGDEATASFARAASGAQEQELSDVPMRMQIYDGIAFGITSVRVETDEGWQQAQVPIDEVELSGAFVVDRDVRFELAFDLATAVEGDTSAGFVFDPRVTASLEPMRGF